MTPFYDRFPELDTRETRGVQVLGAGGPLPPGEYGFVEYYCDEVGCDCRRVLLEVTQPQAPQTPLAAISYGWENVKFYSSRYDDRDEFARETVEGVLDPMQPQSKYARVLLDIFRRGLLTDPEYVARLKQHYAMFKGTLDPVEGPVIDATLSEVQPEPAAAPTPLPPMKIRDILWQLERVPDQSDFAPYERALLAATAQREAITPELIAAIDRVSADPGPCLQEGGSTLHLFAMLLLAQFRERGALDCFLRFFSLPGDVSIDLTGDLFTERGAALLASVCNGDSAPLLKLAHDETVSNYVRSAAIQALVVQEMWEERSRESVIEELRRLFETLAKPGCPQVWAGLICAIGDFRAQELEDEARQAFADGLVDELIVGLDTLEDDLQQSPADLSDDWLSHNEPINAVVEASVWLCFRDPDVDEPWDDEDEPLTDHLFTPPPYQPPTATPLVAPPKVGRNDPCPCGSGKKFKKCCGN